MNAFQCQRQHVPQWVNNAYGNLSSPSSDTSCSSDAAGEGSLIRGCGRVRFLIIMDRKDVAHSHRLRKSKYPRRSLSVALFQQLSSRVMCQSKSYRYPGNTPRPNSDTFPLNNFLSISTIEVAFTSKLFPFSANQHLHRIQVQERG